MANRIRTEWLDSSTITYLPEVDGYFNGTAFPVGLDVDAGTGTVLVEMQDSADAWAVIPSGTFNVDDVVQIEVANLSCIRIRATGNAQYRVTWGG